MAEPNSKTVLAAIVIASCCSTRATAGPEWVWLAAMQTAAPGMPVASSTRARVRATESGSRPMMSAQDAAEIGEALCLALEVDGG